MRRFTYFLSSLFFLAAACGAPQQEQADTASIEEEVTDSKFTVWETAPNPESVSIGEGNVYVTQFGPELKPTVQDGDGYIAVYDANGTLTDTLVTGLDAPKGSLVTGGVLHVVDVDSLLGFSTLNGERVYAVSFTGEANFLNGLCRCGDELYVSATDAGKIWRVDTEAGTKEVFAELPAVNGIDCDRTGETLYAVQYIGDDPEAGSLRSYATASGEEKIYAGYTGLLDGVVEQDSNLYITDWNPAGFGRIVKHDLRTGEFSTVLEDSLFAGPADFEMLGDGLAFIPMLTGSRVIAIKLD